MRDESKAERQREIEAVAYRLIRDHGYGGVSMLAIAKEAKASNETLYRWYGSKRGLLAAMVERNAQATADALQAAIEDGGTLSPRWSISLRSCSRCCWARRRSC